MRYKFLENKGGICINKVKCIIMMSIITILLLVANVYAYENDIFEMDVPSDYVEMSYSGLYTFVKSEDKGIVIYTYNEVGLKKNLSAMSQSEIEELIDIVVKDDVTIIQQEKEKLGKAKAIKARVENDGKYIDMYILVSDKHILLVSFTAPTESELDSEEYLEIKKSFRMKEKTTNATFVKIGLGALACVGGVLKFKNRFML